MAYIHSANQSNFSPIEPLGKPVYVHGSDTRRGYIPLAFQVTSPYDINKVLLPHALIAHVNPSSFAETFAKKVERAPTRGGYVEWHWGDDLTEVSVEQSTGAFINLYTGLSSLLRQRTIAWDRYRDLYDLFRNNGSVYNPEGAIVLQGWILLMFDRGTYVGTFRTFSVEETDDSPFAFKLSWTFKVEKIIHQIPQNSQMIPFRTAEFQSLNRSTSGALNPKGVTGGQVPLPPGLTPEQAVEQSRQEAYFKALAKQNDKSRFSNDLAILQSPVGDALTDTEYDLTLSGVRGDQRQAFRTYFNNLPSEKK